MFSIVVLKYAAAAKSLQSCPTLCDPIDGSLPGCPIPGILQARTLEWVAISFSNAWKWKVNMKSLSCVWLLATPQTAAYQAPPSLGFSRPEYWSGVPLPSLLKYDQDWNGKIWLRCGPQWESRWKQFLCSSGNKRDIRTGWSEKKKSEDKYT